MESKVEPEKLLGHLGGCGRYQVLLATTLHAMKLTIAWAIYAMVLAAAVPKWRCKSGLSVRNVSVTTNMTVLPDTNTSLEKTCSIDGQPCDIFEFDDDEMTTMVSEVDIMITVYIKH